MSISELGDLGDFLGGIAVVITLIYLAVQLRHNTSTARVQAVQHMLSSDTTVSAYALSGPIPEILAKLRDEEELSRAEISIYVLYMRSRLTEMWQVFYQRQNRMIEPDVADALLQRVGTMQSGLFRTLWNDMIKHGFPPDFQAYIESVLSEESG